MFAPVPRAYGRVVLQRADLPTDSPPSLPSPPPLSRTPLPLSSSSSPPLFAASSPLVFVSSPLPRLLPFPPPCGSARCCASSRMRGCAFSLRGQWKPLRSSCVSVDEVVAVEALRDYFFSPLGEAVSVTDLDSRTCD